MKHFPSTQPVQSQVDVTSKPHVASGDHRTETSSPPLPATPVSPSKPRPASSTSEPASGVDGGASAPPTAPTDAAAEVAPHVSAELVPEAVPEADLAQVTSAEAAELALTQPQRLAIVSLRNSPSRIKAAAAAQVTRQTLWRWMNQDPAFQAAYNAWQQDLIETAHGELLTGMRDAVQTLLRAARTDPKYAWRLLESQGVTQPPKPGSTDVQSVAEQQAMQKRVEVVKRKRMRVKLEMAEAMADLQMVNP